MSTDLQSEATVPEPDETAMGSEPTAVGDTNQQFQEIWEKVSGVLGICPIT
jgi:hypothetical protein